MLSSEEVHITTSLHAIIKYFYKVWSWISEYTVFMEKCHAKTLLAAQDGSGVQTRLWRKFRRA